MKLSLIMPIYNGSKYIENTISHILKTNSDEFELLLVNDGSKDDSEIICKRYVEKDARVKLINKTNGGIADARNTGVTNSVGDYLAFVDQDDFIELENVLSIVNSQNEDIILFSTVKDYGDRQEPCDTVSVEKTYINKKDIFEKCIWPMVYPISNSKEVSYFGHVWQGAYKASVIKSGKVSFKKFVSIEDDFVFMLEALVASESVRFVPVIGYRWVINLASTTYKTNHIENMREKCETYYEYTNELLKQTPFYNRDYEDKYIKMSKQVLGVRLVINECSNSSFISGLNTMKNYIKENYEYFSGEYLGQGASRRSAGYIYILLKYKMVLTALLFQKMLITYKRIKSRSNNKGI